MRTLAFAAGIALAVVGLSVAGAAISMVSYRMPHLQRPTRTGRSAPSVTER